MTTATKLTKAQQKVMDIAQVQGYVSHSKGISIHTLCSLRDKGLLVSGGYNIWKLPS